MAFTKPKSTTNETRVRKFEAGLLFWIPYDGIINTNDLTKLEWMHSLCDLREVGPFSFSAINEREIQDLGKVKLTINDGVQVDPFTIQMNADAVENIASFAGVDLGLNRAVNIGDVLFQRNAVGALMLLSTPSETGVTSQSSTIIHDISVKFTELGGMTNGENLVNVTFFSESATASITSKGFVHGCEVWFDNQGGSGSVVNTDAPDGTLEAFVLGTGNDSFAAATTPTAEVIDGSQGTTAVDRFMTRIGLVATDGTVTDVDDAVVTFVVGTSTITYSVGNPPADGAKLVSFYVTAIADMPHEQEIEEAWSDVNIT